MAISAVMVGLDSIGGSVPSVHDEYDRWDLDSAGWQHVVCEDSRHWATGTMPCATLCHVRRADLDLMEDALVLMKLVIVALVILLCACSMGTPYEPKPPATPLPAQPPGYYPSGDPDWYRDCFTFTGGEVAHAVTMNHGDRILEQATGMIDADLKYSMVRAAIAIPNYEEAQVTDVAVTSFYWTDDYGLGLSFTFVVNGKEDRASADVSLTNDCELSSVFITPKRQ